MGLKMSVDSKIDWLCCSYWRVARQETVQEEKNRAADDWDLGS